jgi:AcrR family transcriptional regulator
VTFDAIAAETGVTKTLPYAYFPSVDEVLVALFDETIVPVDRAIRRVVAGGDTFEETVRAAIGVWFDAIRKDGAAVAGLLGGSAVPALAARIERRDVRSHKLWHDVAVDRLGIADPAAHVFAAMLNSTATSVVGLWVDRRGSRDELIDAFASMASAAAIALGSGLA